MNKVVEIDGDEMTRVMWQMVKERLLEPYIELNTEYYDLGLENREKTNDQITIDAAEAIKKHTIGVKCATITPNASRVEEYNLKKQYKSPNGTIRGILDGTVFRTPILVNNIQPFVKTWKKPITIGRHAYGDVYKNQEILVTKPGKAELIFTSEDREIRKTIHEFTEGGILQGIHNTDDSIKSFAKSCFTFAYDKKIDLWFSAKDTISKTYDSRFRDIFQHEYDENWKSKFESAGLIYFYTLIDDVVARVMKSEGGFLWACKNYDGDVMSDMLASAFGSLAMMTSVLVSPSGYYEFEAAHGTVQRHYYNHQKGEETSTNSMALIFAWSGALKKRGELDNNTDLVEFCNNLEAAAIDTIESGVMTWDLIQVAIENKSNKKVNTAEFIDAVKNKLDEKLN